jgi:hypothetical protein
VTPIADLADPVAHEHDRQAAVIPASVAEHVLFSGQARRNIRENLADRQAAAWQSDRSHRRGGLAMLPALPACSAA